MVKWWKDRDKVFPIVPPQSPRHHGDEAPEDQEVVGEDVGDVAHDDFDELDDVEPPDRGVDE